MPSPFPGMDPYIEAPRIWSDFHGDLAAEIRAELNRHIRPTYFAALTPYITYDTIEVTQSKTYSMYPDVGIWKNTPRSSGGVAVLDLVESTAVESTVSLEVPLELFSVEIRTAGDEILVTSIEILSPVNKQRSHDAHLDYQRKRRDLLRSSANLLEIDLLRGGVRPALQQHPVSQTPRVCGAKHPRICCSAKDAHTTCHKCVSPGSTFELHPKCNQIILKQQNQPPDH